MREGHVGSFDGFYGRFSPERRYNMDPVPMPFIVDQGTTYTEGNDKHVHIRGTGSEGLTKRQYTIHIFVNAGLLHDSAYGYIDLVCRGTGKRILGVEKAAYNPKINVLCQKNAWVDREVMLKISTKFIEYKK